MDAALHSRSVIASYAAFLRQLSGLGLTNRLMREAAADGGLDGAFSLRHDVDYHLGRALLMGRIEQDQGLRGTYYLLPPGHDTHARNYYGRLAPGGIARSREVVEGARALVEMGHEVGLHNDFIYLSKLTGVPAAELIADEVRFFAGEGVPVTGSASHGSKFSRRHNFVNYEVFAECDRAKATVYVDRDDPTVYGRTIAESGFSFPLNSVRMGDVGLDYEAYFVGPCLYLMDSGGQATVRWFADGQPVVRTLDEVTADSLAEALAESGAPGVQALIHADHWTFSDAVAAPALKRRMVQADPETAPNASQAHILPETAIDRMLDGVIRRPGAVLTHHGRADPGETDAAVVMLQLYAGQDPEAVNRFAARLRARGAPYTLFAFARWHDHAWGTVEDYLLDWDALAADVDSGLATVGYLYNALHLADGDLARAHAEVGADIDRLRARGMDCTVMAPFMGPRSPLMPTVADDDWARHAGDDVRCVAGPNAPAADAAYSDASLPRAAKLRSELDPVAWAAANILPGRRVTMSFHPHHYGPVLTLDDGLQTPWMRALRRAAAEA